MVDPFILRIDSHARMHACRMFVVLLEGRCRFSVTKVVSEDPFYVASSLGGNTRLRGRIAVKCSWRFS